MIGWQEAAIVLGLFILRLGIPLAITLAVGYGLRRLDSRWQAEALARQAEAVLARQQSGPEPAVEMFKIISRPCWVLKQCPEATYTMCPACRYSELPCWLARFRTEGRLSHACYQCDMFTAEKIARHSRVPD